jgi:hypothetical protein
VKTTAGGGRPVEQKHGGTTARTNLAHVTSSMQHGRKAWCRRPGVRPAYEQRQEPPPPLFPSTTQPGHTYGWEWAGTTQGPLLVVGMAPPARRPAAPMVSADKSHEIQGAGRGCEAGDGGWGWGRGREAATAHAATPLVPKPLTTPQKAAHKGALRSQNERLPARNSRRGASHPQVLHGGCKQRTKHVKGCLASTAATLPHTHTDTLPPRADTTTHLNHAWRLAQHR